MKFAAIDIETTGLDPETCQVLQIGAVIADTEDNKWQHFDRLVSHDQYSGDAYALQLNVDLLRRLVAGEGMSFYNALLQLHGFLNFHVQPSARIDGKILVAGKNFANFDLRFLSKSALWGMMPVHRRFIDVGNLYWKPQLDGPSLPDMSTCQVRAGLSEVVLHDALDDARQIARCVVNYIKAGETL